MRIQSEIYSFINELKNLNVGYSKSKEIEAMIDVLENDWEYDDIEEQYYDGNVTEIESMALMVLDFKDGKIEKEEILCYYEY